MLQILKGLKGAYLKRIVVKSFCQFNVYFISVLYFAFIQKEKVFL